MVIDLDAARASASFARLPSRGYSGILALSRASAAAWRGAGFMTPLYRRGVSTSEGSRVRPAGAGRPPREGVSGGGVCGAAAPAVALPPQQPTGRPPTRQRRAFPPGRPPHSRIKALVADAS